MNKIFFNFIGIYDKLLFTKIKSIIIQIFSNDNLEIFNQYYDIKYYLDKSINDNKYFIEVSNINTMNLTSNNFIINIPSNINFIYNWYKNEAIKSIIIFNNFNYYPIIFLGLPNIKSSPSIKINYGYNDVISEFSNNFMDVCDGNGIKEITLFNNYNGSNNYLLNTIQVNGSIYEICIQEINGITDLNSLNIYKIFKIKKKLNLQINTNVYFYQKTNLFASIVYLNNYNFIDFKEYVDNYESIILLIEYIDSPGNIYSKLELSNNIYNHDNYSNCYNSSETIFYTYNDLNQNETVSFDINVPTVYTSILSLNLQTFNSTQLKHPNDNEYYNTLFFYNYVNKNYYIKSIKIFCYDYNKYFVNYSHDTNPKKNPILYNIGSIDCDLYDIIIKNDINIDYPKIMDLNYAYLLVNIDLINMIKLIKFECENNNFYNFTKSTNINLQTLIDYFMGFSIKKYNVYKIYNENINYQEINKNHNKTELNNSTYINYNYMYDNNVLNFDTPQHNYKFNKKVNFNNNIMNCIKCKIVFLFANNSFYSFDAKLFLDNYDIQIYHKKYNFEDNGINEEKKKLIKMLLFFASATTNIKIIFYENNNYINQNPYYLFNQINLLKTMDDFSVFFNIIGKKNNYQNNFLKFNLVIKKKYFILFLYIEKNIFLATFEQLVFIYLQYSFKILKLNNPNSNLYENKDLFYISFNSLEEINIFMNYLEFGIFNINPKKISTYFNFDKSVKFKNYYNINNYWVLESTPPHAVPYNDPIISESHNIYFSINNLELNQIFLYGDLYIKNYV